MRNRVVPLVIVVALAAAGCTRPENESSSTAATSDPDTADVDDTAAVVTNGADTTAAPTSSPTTAPTSTSTSTSTSASSSTVPPTSAPTTTPTTAPTVTTAPAATTTTTVGPIESADDLTLVFDGILPLRFGDRDVDVVPELSAVFGSPTSDSISEYPIADDGAFLNDDDEQFVAPFGRQVCWDSGLCTQFGAGAPESLIFTGWRVEAGGTSALATPDGVSVGETWADHADVITVDPFDSCFSVAYAAAEGVEVTLQSSGDLFAAPNDDGEFVAGDPDPATTTVIGLSAGELPVFRFADC